MIDAILTNTMLPELSSVFLTKMVEGETLNTVHVGAGDGELTYAFT